MVDQRFVRTLFFVLAVSHCISSVQSFSRYGGVDGPKRAAQADFAEEISMREIYHDHEDPLNKMGRSIHFGDLEKFKGFYAAAQEKHGIDQDYVYKDVTGNSVLSLAVGTDALEIVHFLIKKLGAKTDVFNDDGLAPIHVAMTLDNKEMFKALIHWGVNWTMPSQPTGMNPDARTPWFEACRGARKVDTAFLGVMLKEGQNPFETDEHEYHCIKYVTRNPGSYKLLKNLRREAYADETNKKKLMLEAKAEEIRQGSMTDNEKRRDRVRQEMNDDEEDHDEL
mmetsp:Transcript_9951/g.11548  ORF Transcript_9951/g.11548 Transcript_9951/m.11548 type:complete len:281 (-) Transcript_9951:504-1346(-)|eukprot:CAMPEP_0197850016 /NCGR_PEP_ID=MMETSP1438-20131217/13977_1 /TAXON_ID=1461541 /ORGANISM="Pterosperma sp., Strain CCMP1384" /LENGTH=280 /DNA_ID=CAMNT_0043462959 /DNA_START=190 /DNA_END=1032 /DNA_ORIENTATION=-